MDKFWNKIITCDINDVSFNNFWSALNVWIYRSHIINRKIVGVEILETWKISLQCHINEIIVAITEFNISEIVNLKQQLKQIFETSEIISNDSFKEETSGCFIQLRKLLPRHNLFFPVLELLLIDKTNRKAIFIPSKDVETSPITPSFVYMFHLSNLCKLELFVPASQDHQDVSVTWLKTKVFPKITRWCLCENSESTKPSLSEISIKDFAAIYTNLKTKYAKTLVQNWPESTDPLKYVYEDIGIAAYLMALWNKERELLNLTEKQSFVDLGCGNGLLVHILTLEGYPGIGIDVRKREVWNMYGPETKLIEKTIIPSDSNLFPEYDWLIGNHSDELTPWIPVIAARSSYKMRVFLLPCCCFTFNGKFGRPSTGRTKYQAYLDFIEELCQVMGFNVYIDKLRIPSTKRVCFICSSRNYDSSSEIDINSQRTEFINKHSKDIIENDKQNEMKHKVILQDSNLENSKLWAESFVPKEKNEIVRNCSTLDTIFIESTIKLIADMLLKQENFIELNFEDKILWNRGGNMHIKDIADAVGSDVLVMLKNQCGGLQTLIRSHRNVFTEQKGSVSLSIPSTENPLWNKRRKKMRNEKLREQKLLSKFATKPCFFYFHHPQGCPLENKCTFSHVISK